MPQLPAPVIARQSFTLKPLELSFAPSIQRNIAHWDILKYLEKVSYPYPADGAVEYIQRTLPAIERGEVYCWGIFLPADPAECVGLITYTFCGDHWSRGFWLGCAYQGNGIMSAAVTATLEFMFDVKGIGSLRLTNAKSNAASRHVKLKTGAQYIGDQECEPYNSGDTLREVWEQTQLMWKARKAQ